MCVAEEGNGTRSAQKCGPGGKRRVENCGQILFPAAGPAHPRLCCLCCELEVEKSAVKEDFWIEGVVGGAVENLSSNRFGTYLSPCQQSFSGFLNEFE